MKKCFLILGLAALLAVPAGVFAQRSAGQAEQAAEEAAREVERGVERAASRAEEALREAQLGDDNLPAPLYRVRRLIGSQAVDSGGAAAGTVEDAVLSAPGTGPALVSQVLLLLEGDPDRAAGRYLLPVGRLALEEGRFRLADAALRGRSPLPEGEELSARLRQGEVSAARLLDDPVLGSDGQEVGTLDDVVFDLQTGRVAYAVLGSGGVIGFGEKRIAVPYGEISYDPEQEEARVGATAAQVQNSAGFPRDRWPQRAEEDWRGEPAAGPEQPSAEPQPPAEPAAVPGARTAPGADAAAVPAAGPSRHAGPGAGARAGYAGVGGPRHRGPRPAGRRAAGPVAAGRPAAPFPFAGFPATIALHGTAIPPGAASASPGPLPGPGRVPLVDVLRHDDQPLRRLRGPLPVPVPEPLPGLRCRPDGGHGRGGLRRLGARRLLLGADRRRPGPQGRPPGLRGRRGRLPPGHELRPGAGVGGLAPGGRQLLPRRRAAAHRGGAHRPLQAGAAQGGLRPPVLVHQRGHGAGPPGRGLPLRPRPALAVPRGRALHPRSPWRSSPPACGMPAGPAAAATSLERHDRRGALRAFAARPILLAFAALTLLSAATYSQVGFGLPLAVSAAFGAKGPGMLGMLTSFNALVVIVLGIPVARALRALSPLACMALSGVFFVAGFGLLAWPLAAAGFFLSTFVWTVGEIVASVNMGVFLARHSPVNWRGSFQSFNGAFSQGGWSLGPLLSGLLLRPAGLAALWAATAAACALWAAGALLLDRWDRRLVAVSQAI